MAKRTKYWKTGLILATALAFSIGSAAPSRASSLAEVAQWYTTVYGGQLIQVGATPASASPTQTLPVSTSGNAANTTSTTAPVATTPTNQSSLVNYYLTQYEKTVAPVSTPTYIPAPASTTMPTTTASVPTTTTSAPTTTTSVPTTTTSVPTTTTLPAASAIWSGYSADYSLNAGEQQLLSLVNQQRVANNLPAYTVNLKLSYLARLRAQDMANHQTLTHYSPTYGTPPQMEEAAGIYGNPMGAENICEGPSVTVDNSALFNSAPHRANLLDPQETQIGLGVVQSPNGIVWVSELFLGN